MSEQTEEMPAKRNTVNTTIIAEPSFTQGDEETIISHLGPEDTNEVVGGATATFNDEEEDLNSYIDDDEESSSDEEEEEEDDGIEEPEVDNDDDEEVEQEQEDDDDDGDDDDDDDEEEEDESIVGEDEEDDVDRNQGKKARKTIKRGGKKPVTSTEEEEQIQYGIESDDDDDAELDKFDEATREQYLLDFHPEALAIDFDQVRALCTLVRDINGDIVDPFHKTVPVLTKYEKARILGLRAKQLNSNIAPNIEVPDNVIDGYLIAEMELKQKRIPFIIRRPLPNGTSEYWRLEDLEVLY
jgi:DNA-directed RNA polymerase subunit K/omega